MIKRILSVAITLFAFMQIQAAVVITESAGWIESAYVEWSPLAGADSYNIYYKEASEADDAFKKIDGMLIREYAACFRADMVGLKAGNYILKVVPVSGETEDASNAAVTGNLEVKAHAREGFAFSQNSKYKTASGAYNNDGTLKSTANVIYVTNANANTVELNVVTSSKGAVTTCKGIGEILSAKQKGYDTTPLSIRIVGELKIASMSAQVDSKGYLVVKGKSADTELNITVEGIGEDAVINGGGFLIRNAGNVEIRNLGVMNFSDDGISLDTDNVNIWIHHIDFFYGKNKGGDQDKGDGSLDVKSNSKYVTLSFNHFWDSGKSSLCGMTSESGPNYITYHHNWFDHSDSRHPRVRTMTVHVYNNFFDGIAKYAVGATMGASVFVENNYFKNTKNPMLISKQGTDILNDSDGSGTFSGEAGGIIKAYGNYLDAASSTSDRYKPYSSSNTTHFDAYIASSRDETVPNTVKTLSGNNTYNNFDTNSSIMYAYNVETAENAMNTVKTYAGRVNGGDLKFTFTDADAASYAVNSDISSKVANYSSSIKSIGFGDLLGGDNGGTDGGDGNGDGNGDGGNNGDGGTIPTGDVVHNFTENGTSSTFFNITGSTSTGKTSPSFNGLSLTTCLKIESGSKTLIAFALTEEATLTLVFNNAGKTVKINGVEETPDSNGLITQELTPGDYEIMRGNGEAYLFYMSIKYKETTGIENTENNQFSLYPNPVVDKLYINSDAEIQRIEIFGLAGNLIQRINGNVSEIDMTSLNAGSYLVRIYSDRGITGKVIIKN